MPVNGDLRLVKKSGQSNDLRDFMQDMQKVDAALDGTCAAKMVLGYDRSEHTLV